MDSKEEADGHRHNMATENSDTVALLKKRARRVSFAEMTSVHFFDRDEESNETPLARTAKLVDDSPVQSGFFRQMELNKEFGCEDDGNDNDEDEEEEMQRSFFRPVGSPSPGGSTFGSASSNDEDNFFGPVSANFIRPGRLSDSAASDDNHDVTMDSTAFSMHYRSLARSESGVDLKTPTGGPLFFEEKTLTNANTGSSTIVVLGKNPIAESSVPVTEVSGSHNSNDMSIVGEKSNKYDYERLSPGLVALLAESRNNFLNVSALDGVITSPSPKQKESEVLSSVDQLDNLVNLSDSVRKETGLINSYNLLSWDESAAQGEFVEANGPNRTLSSGPPEKRSSNALVAVTPDRDNHKPDRSPSQFSKKESDIPLVASTSSPVKLQQTLLTTASPANYWRMATPLLEQPGSLLRNETVEHQETETSIQKSMSKLELLEKSAFSSTFRAKVDSSTVKSLDFLRSPNVDTFFEKSRNISRINFVEDPVTEEKLTSVHSSKSYAFSMNHATADTLNHISGENHSEEHLGPKGEKSPNEMFPKNISRDQSRYLGPAASPSKITWPGNNLMNSLFPSNHSNEDSLPTETETFLAEIVSGEGGKAVFTPKSTSSAGRMFGTKLSASPGLQSFQSKDLLPRSPLKQISDSYKGRDSTPEGNLADINLSNAAVNRDAVSKGMNGELSSPFIEANSLKNLTEVNVMDKGEVGICNGNEMFETIDNFSTSAKEHKFQFMHSTNLDEVNITSRDILRIEDNVPDTESRAVSHGSVSSPTCKNLEESRLQKSALESPTASPSRKELGYKLSTRIPSPQTTQLSGSAKKRNIELLLNDTQHRTETAITQRSPKLQKTGNPDGETILYPNEGRPTLTGHEKKWTDSYSKFSEDVKRLISRSTDQLNRKMIDMLEDVLVHQQRSKIFEMLHLGVMPQNTTVHDTQLDKIAETKSMLHQVVFENAKLQLKHAKRDRLLKRLQLLNSRIQESQVLKENIVSQPLKTCTINVLVDAVGDRSLLVNSKKGHEVCHENLTAMRQSLEALDGKILHLTKTFHACCKMKAEPSCVDTIALVNKHLIRRASFRFLRQDFQMWVVQSVDSMNGQLNVVLSYLDFIVQSIKITVGPTSSVATSFKLNETNIIKNFPNMDASIAFAFVFNAERACKFVGSRTLASETQMTGSLIGSLVDVVEEVQSAQLEFQNLTQSSFCSPSVEQLDLMLCFHNFNTGRKVSLTLDMSCLKLGIYPSEIIPVQPSSPPGGRNDSFSKQIFDEIRHAVKRIRPGYTRILRLCRCISQVVQSSTS